MLESRGSTFSNFLKAGAEFRDFFTNAPVTFTQEIENSGEPSKAVSNTLHNFRRRNLYLWDEQYTVLEKTLQMTSNTLILNNLLASNFDQWYVSNAAIVFKDQNLDVDYLKTAAKVKQFKEELDSASEHMSELEHSRPARASRPDSN